MSFHVQTLPLRQKCFAGWRNRYLYRAFKKEEERRRSCFHCRHSTYAFISIAPTLLASLRLVAVLVSSGSNFSPGKLFSSAVSRYSFFNSMSRRDCMSELVLECCCVTQCVLEIIPLHAASFDLIAHRLGAPRLQPTSSNFLNRGASTTKGFGPCSSPRTTHTESSMKTKSGVAGSPSKRTW